MELDPRVEEVRRLGRIRQTGCRMRSQEHALSHHRWARWARLLAISTAAVAGLGGIGAIGSAEAGSWLAVVGGALVVIGVLTRAIDEGLGTAKTAADHHRAAARFRDLQLQYLALSQFPPSDPQAAENKLLQIQAQAVEAETESPLVEEWAREAREERDAEAKAAREAHEREAADSSE